MSSTVLQKLIPQVKATLVASLGVVVRTSTAVLQSTKRQLAGIISKTLKKLSILLLALFAAQAMAGYPELPVKLGTAGNFTVLAKTGISTTGTTKIVGDIGVSPAAATYVTGFGLSMDPSNQFSTSSLVVGSVFAADYTPPTPAVMTTAISDMEIAYTDAAARTIPTATELYAGNLGGKTIAPGLYKWSTGVIIPTDVTIAGGANDIWIFQIAQTLDISAAKKVILSGGAQAKNIFWQVAGQATLGTTSAFNGIILSQVAIVLNTGATLNGRALAQSAVTLDANHVVSVPGPYTGPNPPSQGKSFIYPSPARGRQVHVVYPMAEPGQSNIRIWNENGDLVFTLDEQKQAGSQKGRIPIVDFAPGVYIYKIVATYDSGRVENMSTQKFSVAK